MKRKLLQLFLIISIGVSAQSDLYTVLYNNNSTSGNGRAPQGATRYNRSVWLITAAEMTASGFANGSSVTSLGFNFSTAQNIATTGNIVIYLQNTTDVVNNKSTDWATAISGMTTVSNGPVTIPAATGNFDIPFVGGSPFTYTGGAVYVAFDYQNPTNPTATTPNAALCTTTLANGLQSAFSATAAPTTIAASNFRPETILGRAVLCARPRDVAEIIAAKTTTSVTGTWTNGTLTSLEYGPYGFTPGTGTVISEITSPYVLGGLSPSTVYDVYFYNNCGTTGSPVYSEGTEVESFHTVFQPASPSYNTSFEQESFPFMGWLAVPDNTGNSWFVNFGGTGSPLVQQGQNSAVAITPLSPAVAASERLFSRGVNLTAGSTTTITYYVRNYQNGSTGLASYQLTVGTTQAAASQTTVLATETGISNTAFALKTFNFTPSVTGTYYFSFLHNSPAVAAGTHALIVDNFTVSEVLSRNDYLLSKVSVYPNPAKNLVKVDLQDAIEINKVEFTDINGRTVKSFGSNTSSTLQMNISDLMAGVYLMKIETSQGPLTKKIIKE